MAKKKKLIPTGVWCILVIVIIFGYMGSVMGFTNMLNTIMKTAHDLLINTVFYLMGMCVITGALGKLLVEFGVVDLLQKALRPVMKPLFNLPGVASLGAVLTFLSDNPAIISLCQDRKFSSCFKKYQHISLVNFGTTFGMGLLVIIFMMGQGFFTAPFIGLAGAVVGCMITTRLMQYFTCKDYPEFRNQNALSDAEMASIEEEEEDGENKQHQGGFIRILNALLDGGKSGVEIGLAIIPGVLVISTFVMMLTFGGSVEGVDAMGNDIVVYTGGAYQGTRLLPWLAGKVSFIFKWLFGFTAPELVAFPITALGAVGAALGLIPEFASQGIIDGNAIAVFTAMGMCWSGFLSTHAATLDSLGYRSLISRAYTSHFIAGIGAGIFTHWLYVGITFISSLFAPQPVWEVDAQAWNVMRNEPYQVQLLHMEDSSYVIRDWFGTDQDLEFTVNSDKSITITNAYADKNDIYFVNIDTKAVERGDVATASIYTPDEYTLFEGDAQQGHMYMFTWLRDHSNRVINGGYYEITWGGAERETNPEFIKEVQQAVEIKIDSLNRAHEDSLALENGIVAIDGNPVTAEEEME